MKLHIATEGLELTPETREIVEKKFIPKVKKFFKHQPSDAVSAMVILKKRARWGFRVKCDLDIPGQNVHIETTHKELAFAVVELAKEVARKLQKQKERKLR